MQTVSHSFTEALSHAFAQPDIGFLTNDGALPMNSTEGEQEANRYSDDSVPSIVLQPPEDNYMMSGGLDNDLERQARTQGVIREV